jgi:hypothetical protein
VGNQQSTTAGNRRRQRRRPRRNPPQSEQTQEQENENFAEDYESYEITKLDENKKISCSDATTTLDIKQGNYNAKRKMTSVVLNSNDSCPICLRQWDQFVETSIVAILECSHTCCAICLFNLHRECTKTQMDQQGTYMLPFSCTLCR